MELHGVILVCIITCACKMKISTELHLYDMLRAEATTLFSPKCNIVVGLHSVISSPLLICLHNVHQYYFIADDDLMLMCDSLLD